jgi:hypothetical protein
MFVVSQATVDDGHFNTRGIEVFAPQVREGVYIISAYQTATRNANEGDDVFVVKSLVLNLRLHRFGLVIYRFGIDPNCSSNS